MGCPHLMFEIIFPWSLGSTVHFQTCFSKKMHPPVVSVYESIVFVPSHMLHVWKSKSNSPPRNDSVMYLNMPPNIEQL